MERISSTKIDVENLNIPGEPLTCRSCSCSEDKPDFIEGNIVVYCKQRKNYVPLGEVDNCKYSGRPGQ